MHIIMWEIIIHRVRFNVINTHFGSTIAATPYQMNQSVAIFCVDPVTDYGYMFIRFRLILCLSGGT